MDIMTAIKYPLKDKQWWLKCLICFGLSLVLIGLPAVIGYTMLCARKVAQGDEVLPEFGDFGTLYVDGLRFMLTGFAYALPGIIVMGFALCPMMACTLTDSEAGAALGLVSSVTTLCVGLGITLVAGFLIYPAYVIMLKEEGFGAGFQFSRITALLKSNFMDFVWLILLGTLVQVAFNAVGNLIVIGAIITAPYGAFVMSHLLGQTAIRVCASDASLG